MAAWVGDVTAESKVLVSSDLAGFEFCVKGAVWSYNGPLLKLKPPDDRLCRDRKSRTCVALSRGLQIRRTRKEGFISPLTRTALRHIASANGWW